MTLSDQEWVRVAALGDLEPGALKQVEVDLEEVVLANVDGEILALSDVCSHQYVYLSDGFLEGETVECPQHGSKFSMRTGEVLNPPATQPVATYEVKIEEDGIYLKGPKEPDLT